MINREQYTPGPARGAQIRKGRGQHNNNEEKWTLILVRELRHSPEKVWQALTDPAHLRAWAPFRGIREGEYGNGRGNTRGHTGTTREYGDRRDVHPFFRRRSVHANKTGRPQAARLALAEVQSPIDEGRTSPPPLAPQLPASRPCLHSRLPCPARPAE